MGEPEQPVVDYELPSKKFRRNATYFLGFAVIFSGVSMALGFDPLKIIYEFSQIVDLVERMAPPNMMIFVQQRNLFDSIGETIAMAFLGSFFGGLLALMLAFLAASNTTPHPIASKTTRTLFAIERSIPQLVTMLVFQVAVGIGPFSAALALIIGSIGMFGKLFAESIENVDRGPIESLEAIGATGLQRIRYGIIPAAMPSFISSWFYSFDINLRQAIVLGVYGGGGVGMQLHLAQKTLNYKNMLALVIFIIVLIASMERVSDYLRRKLLGSNTLK